MERQLNIQDAFLNQVRRDKQIISMYLVNGVRVGGVVRAFDSYVVVLEDRGSQQVIYKHAISTMIPSLPVQLFKAENEQ
ncbi:RNA-binding protein Hfq [bioreactor metagenome]|jgi:host factor-I protein|uniref:RNA-binding protein Hfq n=1 Tax=bioreactor metagenome TaxID=1076179 RepID=A0A645CZ04_9ZZZZ|nr:RNA chaperone Hfq [Candidatus Acidoferrum sp.]HWQ50426.1 RNA chaperone Hfq [Terriglobales bacterium]